MSYKGSCYCHAIKYTVSCSAEDARTSLCHCNNCKVRGSPGHQPCLLPHKAHMQEKFFGGAFGLTTKIPVSSFSYTEDSKKPTIHEADNGSGVMLHREFCGTCGSGILEVGEGAMKDFRYIMTGTLDSPGDLPPKGEFWCRRREKWMPEASSMPCSWSASRTCPADSGAFRYREFSISRRSRSDPGS